MCCVCLRLLAVVLCLLASAVPRCCACGCAVFGCFRGSAVLYLRLCCVWLFPRFRGAVCGCFRGSAILCLVAFVVLWCCVWLLLWFCGAVFGCFRGSAVLSLVASAVPRCCVWLLPRLRFCGWLLLRFSAAVFGCSRGFAVLAVEAVSGETPNPLGGEKKSARPESRAFCRSGTHTDSCSRFVPNCVCRVGRGATGASPKRATRARKS